MNKQTYQLIYTITLFMTVCLTTTILFLPLSIILLLGVSAGLSSAVLILWGDRQLLPLIFSCILFNIILHYYFSMEFELSVVLIFILTTCAQGLWAKKLTNTLVSHGEWLDSRKKLSSFIIRVGPLASLISAFSSLLISILSAQSFDINLFYVFCQTWSMSVLVSIFVIPILLFLSADTQLNKGKQLFVITSSILGGISIALLFKIGQGQNEHHRSDDFYKAQIEIESTLNQELLSIEQQIKSLKAYFESSSEVKLESFNNFSSYILSNNSKIDSFQWAPVVTENTRENFEHYSSQVLDKQYIISQQTVMGNNIKVDKAPVYFPVQYVFPRYQNEKLLGVDLFSEADKKEAIIKAINTGKPTATLPINKISGDFSTPVIVIVMPISNYKLAQTYGQYNTKGELPTSGVVVAIVKVSTLFKDMLSFVSEKEINLVIIDNYNNNQYSVYGGELKTPNRLLSKKSIDVFSRNWSYELSEQNTWILQHKSWETWATLLGGTFGGIIFQLLILMMAAYSTELSHRVTQKTRELILSKERSDNENQAKTDFLHSLSIELRTPLSVIKRLVEIFPQKSLSVKEKDYIDNISSAALNLEQLIDTLNELSSIESGRLSINTQVFDFIIFLKRMEEMVEAQTQDIRIVIQEDVPQFIESDELRLQQIFISCAENAKDILDSNNICISVKVHFHQQNSATIVFIIHVLKSNNLIDQDVDDYQAYNEGRAFNLRMEMAKELCHKLGGNINIVQLPSGESMIHVSVKVKVSQEQEMGIGRYNIPSFDEIVDLNTKRILFIEGEETQNKNLYRQLVSLKYPVDVISKVEEVEKTLDIKKYHLVIFDCTDNNTNLRKIPTPLKANHSKITTIALFNKELDGKVLSLVNHKFTAYVVLPIETEKLRTLIHTFFK